MANKKKTVETSDQESLVSVAKDFSFSDKKIKTGHSNFKMLRNIARLNSIVQVSKDTLKHQLTSIDYSLMVKKGDDSEYVNEIAFLHDLFDFPNSRQTYRSFWSQVLEDILVIDRGVIENIYNSNGEIVETYQVDGATIRPRVDLNGQMLDPAYVQVVNGKRVAEFEENEIDLLVKNPKSEIDSWGYGCSPVERVMMSVLSGINAETFNAETFTKSSLPPYLVNVKTNNPATIDALREQWESRSKGNLWSALFIGEEQGMSIEKLKESNQDMQYYDLILWLAKIVIAAFEISPQDVGLTMDVNKATGQSQQQLTKSQGLKTMLTLMEEWHNKKIRQLSFVNSKFSNIVFHYKDLDKTDEKTQAEIDQIYLMNGVYSGDYIRKREEIEDFVAEESSQELKDNKQNTDAVEDRQEGSVQSSRVTNQHLQIKSN